MDMQVPFNFRVARRANPVLEARNQEICIRYAAGETLATIGGSFSISSERVRKILKRFGLDKTNGGLAVRNRDKPRKPPVEPYCLRVYGCTAEELGKFSLAERQAFLQQKTNVKRTDTAWLLSLPRWVEFWTRSRKWDERGQGPSKYGLSRIDPAGPFSTDNVRVVRNYESAMSGRNRKSAANRRDMRTKVRNSDWIREMARILKKPSASISRPTGATK